MEKYSPEAFEYFDSKEFKKDVILIDHRYENLFEDAIRDVIEQLRSKITKLEQEYRSASDKVSNYQEQNDGIPTDEDFAVFDDLAGIAQEQQWSQEQLIALNEMRAIYMFKSIEIRMKALFQTAYPKTHKRGFYKWENMTAFFEEKGIRLDKLDGYEEVLQLKKLNNNLKHSGFFSEDIRKIQEFNGPDPGAAENFEAFIGRVEPKVMDFQNRLSEEVVRELYEFDDAKLSQIAGHFYERMDKNDAVNLVTKIQQVFSLDKNN